VTDFALHYLTPALAVAGWLWFGPRRDHRLVPVPFLEVDRHGDPFALAGVAIVMAVGVAVGVAIRALSVWLDGRLPARPAGG